MMHVLKVSCPSLGLKDEKAKERESLLLAAHLNQAMCCLKVNDFSATRDHCTKALEMDPKNEKGLFRMGQVGGLQWHRANVILSILYVIE